MRNIKNNSGYVIIINTLIFMTISVILLSGVVNPILSHYVSAKGFTESKKSFQLANSAGEEVMYRLRSNKNLPSSFSLSLDSRTANVSIASSQDTKTVTINMDEDYERNITMNIEQDVGVSFSYGIQTGLGGLEMAGGATVNGNVYANGNITGSGGAYISGSASVSNASDPVANQTNGTVFPPAYSIDFGANSGPQDMAQSFQVSTTTEVSSIRLYIKKTGTTNDIDLILSTQSGSGPYKNPLTTQTIPASQITTSYNYITVTLPTAQNLTIGNTYWIVLDTTSSASGSYSVGASTSTYANGIAKTGTWSGSNGGTWNNTTPSGLDSYFDIYVGGIYGGIDGVTIGDAGVGDAWAHNVTGTTIEGNLYCKTGSGNRDESNNTKNCDTSREDPVESPFPISDGNIADWKERAELGGTYNGDLNYGSGTYYLGPKKVVGNISINAGGILKIAGNLWVTGDITMAGNAIIELDDVYGSASGVIVSDGNISVSGGADFAGSGTSGSYILVVTTSDCPISPSCGSTRAIDVTGGSGSVVLNAQKGTIKFGGSANAKEATAYKIEMNNATIDYETGLAGLDFSGGPSGSWYIRTWDEVI